MKRKDESIHGVYVGLNYQEIVQKLSEEEQESLRQFSIDLFSELLDNEVGYTRYLYDQVDLALEVIDFVKYNANKGLNNLGYEGIFEHNDVNPIVLNGLNTGNKTHDFFSVKGDSYKKATVVAIQDDDFIFDWHNQPLVIYWGYINKGGIIYGYDIPRIDVFYNIFDYYDNIYFYN